MSIKKFLKKPVLVEAMQFTKETQIEVVKWVTCGRYLAYNWNNEPILVIHTSQGDMICRYGDWVIKSAKNVFYPCNTEILQMTYNELQE